MAGGAIRLTGAHLPDGRHTVSVIAQGDGTFAGSLSRSWAFVVDTHAPKLRLGALPTGWVRDQTLAISGHTQPGARVTAAAHAATAHATAAADGAFALSLTVSDGTIPLVVTATDAAGNRRTVNANVKVDATAPAVTFGLPDVVRSSRPQLKVDVSRHRADARDRPPRRPPHPGRVAPRDAALAGPPHAFRHGPRPRRQPHRAAPALRRRLDRAPGNATLRRGAIGKDVSDLQKLLRRQGYLHGPATGVYASGTVAAVKAFQKASDLPIDGAVGIYTLGALSGRITIDQSAHLLTLERFGHPPVSFPVAVGQPAYPTPDGHFTIISKVENPTWVPPPDAPWAQGAVPIPPGPGNPLGTRWMGLSRARRRDPRHRRPRLDRLQRLARLHPHADPRRGAALHDGQRGHGGLHSCLSSWTTGIVRAWPRACSR